LEEGRLRGYLALRTSGRALVVERLFASRQGCGERTESGLLGAAIRGAFADPMVEEVRGELLGATPTTVELLRAHWGEGVRLRSLLEVAWMPRRHALEGIRPWRREDLPAAAALLFEVYGGDPGFLPDPAFLSPEGFREILERFTLHKACGAFEPEASFAVSGPGGLQGFILATRMGPDRGHVAEVAVAPSRRRAGLGRRLLEACLDALHGLGCPCAHLAVSRENHPALALYKDLGFTEFHRYPDLRLRKG
jgi:ribosomal protein S18 acetylase RimI-like enzyme